MSNITYHKLSWTQLHHDCVELHTKKLKDIEVDVIVSISRGANTISHVFSDLLGMTPISHITISSYQDMKKLEKPKISEEPTRDFHNKNILIIDDVSDSGATFKVTLEYFKKKKPTKIYTLSPYIKPQTTYKPDFWLKSIDAWIIFPYDVRETMEGFEKMFGSIGRARNMMHDVGFEEWEIEAVLPQGDNP
ncbi:MAG: phosphoribosyltransferase family protein [Candidatus Roizmanbacteria bacterium]|nr:phosphoribosyltransferase family protein [Candidatus Roizmanbacteria bacterium]